MKDRRRGRSCGSGLVFFVGVLAACDQGPPAGEALLDYRPPSITERDGWELIESLDPVERLLVYDDPPAHGLQLLYMGRRAATPLRAGGAAWPDADGARVLVFDERGVVARVPQGTLEEGRSLTRPVAVALEDDDIVAFEVDGMGLRFVGDEPREWVSFGVGVPVTGGGRGAMAAARSIFEFHMAPVRPGDPLLWVRDEATHEMMAIGSPATGRDPFLGQLVNSGWTVVDAEGTTTVFASAVRHELVAFDASGDTAWVSRWQPPLPVEEPRLAVVDGSLRPAFTVLQLGVVLGPHEQYYVLATSGEEVPSSPRTVPGVESRPDHILVFDGRGRFLRAGPVAKDAAVFADARGRIYTMTAAEALSRTGEPERAPFPEFDLPRLGHADRISLEAHRGKIVVVNFWASWCGPCRREMPLLDDFAGQLDPDRAVVLGLNDDVDPENALAFIEYLGGVGYVSGEGGGHLRRRYNYRGLPYTVVLDRDLRIVRSFYGFGSSIDPIKDVVESELGG